MSVLYWQISIFSVFKIAYYEHNPSPCHYVLVCHSITCVCDTLINIPLTALSMGSSVCSMFFLISSRGPGLCASWVFSESAKRHLTSMRWRSASDRSTSPTSSNICCLTSCCLSGLCWILAFNRSPILALSNFWRCSWKAGGLFKPENTPSD